MAQDHRGLTVVDVRPPLAFKGGLVSVDGARQARHGAEKGHQKWDRRCGPRATAKRPPPLGRTSRWKRHQWMRNLDPQLVKEKRVAILVSGPAPK